LAAVFFLAGLAVTFYLPPAGTGVPEQGLLFGILIYFLGPSSFIFAVLGINALLRRPILRFSLALIAYPFGAMLFLTLSVNLGRIQP